MKLVFATRNKGKLRELRQLLQLDHLEILALDDIPGTPEVEEDGDTFAENATKKAREIMEATGLPALADDSGLEVDALGGAPGVHSARYAGEDATDGDRINLLLSELQGVPHEQRTARFRCVVAIATPTRELYSAEGVCEGLIAFEPTGQGGFGYDPVFYLPEYGCTMAQLPQAEKNRISHRARAVEAALPTLRRLLAQETSPRR